MGTDDPEHRAEIARDRILEADIFEADKEPMVEFLDAIHPDVPTEVFVNGNGDREQKSHGTVAAYGQGLKRFGEFAEQPLVEMDVTDVNTLFQSLESGEHPDVKDSGYQKSTLSQWQSAVTKFFEYHSELGVDPAEVVVRAQEKTSVDDRDMYTREEVEQLRDAVSNARDRCILELLLNTGQRIRAIQTLRIKDVKPDEGIYYLNTDVNGLKGAEKTGRKRPLLGAQRAVYDWLQNHPTGDRDDYLITVLPSANRGTPGGMLSQDAIRTRLKILADRADIEKPPNPHNFRHYFVTTCKRDYDMDESTIKYLIGHGPGSKVMETTYQHLSDEDHIKEAEIATGRREEEDTSPLTPQVCPTCKEQLKPNAKACPSCGTVFAPDAKQAQEQIEDSVQDAKDDADSLQEHKDLDRVERLIRENPELVDVLESMVDD
ncbi:site-specific integrase [Halapricum hydrolyticum]|uniref:Tyrosine-type recombinase/integrase n=1 Tax=Halapricum hydrolyticum TaxID=2979991 RepID=A0AAE3ID96_9EURY|nr:site-specific integrase [Halapricum hydrolyticum]MCU4718987.1 tyrosine-type recombinase/integrase [Halapricum hydrolyticum]MCU4727916.1 tyrosine-type recombinase/integrase [Halapricum hydrolyticum]